MNNGQLIISPLSIVLTLSVSAIFKKTKHVVSVNGIKSIFHVIEHLVNHFRSLCSPIPSVESRKYFF